MIARRLREGLRESRDSTLANPSVELIDALGGQRTLAGPRMDGDTALAVVSVFSAVTLKANAVRSTPLKVYSERGDGFKDETAGRKSRLWPIVHDEAAPGLPASELWSIVTGHLELRGNAYAYKEQHVGGARDGLVKALWPLDPKKMKVKREDGELVYELHDGAKIEKLSAAEVFHVRRYGVSGLTGLSPVSQCREMLGTVAGFGEFLGRHLGSGAHFGGFLHTEAELKPEERERMEQTFNQKHGTLRNAGKTPLFSGDVKWERTGMSLADQQFIDLLGMGDKTVAQLFGIPPTLINAPVSGSLTYSTTLGESLQFLKIGLQPVLTSIEDALRIDPELFAGSGLEPEFVAEANLRMDPLTRAQALKLAVEGGWLTPNEARRIENREPLEGGDELRGPNGEAGGDDPSELLSALGFKQAPNGAGPAPTGTETVGAHSFRWTRPSWER